MATDKEDEVEAQKPKEDEELALSKDILDKEQLDKVQEIKEDKKDSSIMDNADEDFYTRSMDLSDKDFDLGDEFGEKKMPVVIKIFLILIIIAAIAIAGYFVYMNFFKH